MGGDSHRPLGFMGVAILMEQNLPLLTLDSWAGNPHPSYRIFLPPGVTPTASHTPHVEGLLLACSGFFALSPQGFVVAVLYCFLNGEVRPWPSGFLAMEVGLGQEQTAV